MADQTIEIFGEYGATSDVTIMPYDSSTVLDAGVPTTLTRVGSTNVYRGMRTGTLTGGHYVFDAAGQTWHVNYANATATYKGQFVPIDATVGAVTLAAASIQTIWDALTSALTVVGSVGKALVDGLLSADSTSRLERAARAITLGTVDIGASTTNIPTSILSPAATVANQFKGLILAFDATTITVALRGQKTDITASTSGGVLTVTALTTAPVSSDTFTIE